MNGWVYKGPGGTGISEYYDIHINDDGNIAACGIYDTTYWTDQTVGLFTLLDPSGEVLRNKLWHDTVNSYFTGLTEMDDAYYVTGPRGSSLETDALFLKNHFYQPDTLCGLENIYLGTTNALGDTYFSYEPPFPLHGITQASYVARTGRGAHVTEICSRDVTYGLGITEGVYQNAGIIYPNPFINTFQIDIPEEVVRTTMIDLNGRKIPCELQHNSVSISTTIADGIYVINYELKDGIIYSKRIVKG